MTQSTEPHDPYDIAALRKKKEVVLDMMAVGPGTPWEDRGNLGMVGAFVRTCLAAMFKPRQLAEQIRRPDSRGDTGPFVIGCAILWGLAVVIQSVLTYFRIRDQVPLDHQQYWMNTACQTVAAMGVVWGGLKIATNLYGRLIAFDMKEKPSSVLLTNLLAYGLGPSLLAPIPYLIGPVLAVIWITVSWAAIGRRRLGVKTGAAVITPVLTMAALVVVTVGLYFALLALCTKVWDFDSVLPPSSVTRNP